MKRSRNDLNAYKNTILPLKGNQFQAYHLVHGVKNLKSRPLNPEKSGVPIVAQSLMNLTKNHGVAGLVPGLAPCVRDPALP